MPIETYIKNPIERTQGIASKYDYIDENGVLHKAEQLKTVLITSPDDLPLIKDEYKPGTIAYIAGFESMYQLDVFGVWHPITETQEVSEG